MMNKPPLNELQSKVGCRYMLVTVVGKRARQLMGNEERLQNRKPVSYAVDELYHDRLSIKFPEDYVNDQEDRRPWGYGFHCRL